MVRTSPMSCGAVRAALCALRGVARPGRFALRDLSRP